MSKHLRGKLFFLLGTVTAVIFFGCLKEEFSTDNIPPVEHFQLERYMGRWYEIARLPHPFEEDVSDAQAEYTLRPDGQVTVLNSGFRNQIPVPADGIARSISEDGMGIMEVSFFRPFYGLYKIIYLDKDYQLAIVTSSTMDYVWILARHPLISRQELNKCLTMLKQWGYAVNLLQYPSGMVQELAREN